MAGKPKKNKLIQKSICLSERDWALIEHMGNNESSNGEVIREMIIHTIFLVHLSNSDKNIANLQAEYFRRAEKMRVITESIIKDSAYYEKFESVLDTFPALHPERGDDDNETK